MSGQSTGHLADSGEGAELWLGGPAAQFKIRAEHAGGQLSFTDMTLSPYRLVPPHIHADEDEHTYVVSGTGGVRAGDEEFEAVRKRRNAKAATGAPEPISEPDTQPGRRRHKSEGRRHKSEVRFEFIPLTSAPGRIRTCAHGSGGRGTTRP